jgi:hypothetical protein
VQTILANPANGEADPQTPDYAEARTTRPDVDGGFPSVGSDLLKVAGLMNAMSWLLSIKHRLSVTLTCRGLERIVHPNCKGVSRRFCGKREREHPLAIRIVA